jgi:hypothetical protein
MSTTIEAAVSLTGSQPARPHLVDEPAQHPLGELGVGDHPVAQRPDGPHRRRGAADHLLGPATGRDEAVRAGLDRHHRRLVEHHTAAPDVDQGVGGAEVHGKVAPQDGRTRHGGHAGILGRSPAQSPPIRRVLPKV